MIESFINKIEEHTTLSKSTRNLIMDKSVVKDFKNGDVILEIGDLSNFVGFVISGVFRHFELVHDEDVTTQFIVANELLANFQSFCYDKQSDNGIQCVSDAKVCLIEKEHWREIEANEPDWIKTISNIQIRYLLGLTSFQRNVLFTDSLTSYNLFIEKFPTVANYVKLGYIASFLGIAQETLSRIRNKALKSTGNSSLKQKVA